MLQNSWFEPLSGQLKICVTRTHKFGTDAFLLSDFAAPRRKDIACDLGAGCGIVPVLWFRKPEDAPKAVYAVEVQELAVRQMECTVQNGPPLLGRLLPIHADLRSLQGVIEPGSIDLLTCNPPYQMTGAGIISRTTADKIARHETQCSMEDVCKAAKYLLGFRGRLCVCQRPRRLPDVMEAMRSCQIEPKRLRFVQQRSASAPWLFLLEGRKGGKPFLNVEPPLIVEGEDGFSQEMLRIYQKEAIV